MFIFLFGFPKKHNIYHISAGHWAVTVVFEFDYCSFIHVVLVQDQCLPGAHLVKKQKWYSPLIYKAIHEMTIPNDPNKIIRLHSYNAMIKVNDWSIELNAVCDCLNNSKFVLLCMRPSWKLHCIAAFYKIVVSLYSIWSRDVNPLVCIGCMYYSCQNLQSWTYSTMHLP